MGFFKKIKNHFNPEDTGSQVHLKYLYLIAIAGKTISDEDYEYLEGIGQKLNLSKTKIYEVFNGVQSIKFCPLPDRNSKVLEYTDFALRNGDLSKEVKEALKLVIISVTGILEKNADYILEEILLEVQKPNRFDPVTEGYIGSILMSDFYDRISPDS